MQARLESNLFVEKLSNVVSHWSQVSGLHVQNAVLEGLSNCDEIQPVTDIQPIIV